MPLQKLAVWTAIVVSLASPALAQDKDAGKREDVPCGAAKLVVWTVQDYEEQHVNVWFQNGKGETIHPIVTWPGRFVSLCSRNAFLLLNDTTAHFMPGPSWMMSPTGEVLGRFEFGEHVQDGVTKDEALVWVQSYEFSNGKWMTRLQVVDTHGAIVFSKLYAAAGQVNVDYLGKTYTIDVIKPDLPG